MTILSIIQQLSSTSKRTEKLSILNAHQDNEELKLFFKYALDPMITFGIRKIPEYSPSAQPTMSLSDAILGLDRFVTRDVTGNDGIQYLKNLLGQLSSDDAEVLTRIIDKDPSCGASTGTVNSVWPELVFEFSVMKASPHDEKTIKKIKFPALAQLKLDGARCCLVIRNGSVVALSSSGREIETHGRFDCLAEYYNDVVLDGELLYLNEKGIGFAERKYGNGKVTRAIRGTIPIEESSNLHLVLFDIIPFEAWKSGLYEKPTIERFEELKQDLAENHSWDLNRLVSLVQWRIVRSEEDAAEFFRELYSNGEEGIILKDYRAPWINGRSKLQLKYKGILTCDLQVVGIQPGTGKYEGMVGSLICESSDGLVKVEVGTGLSDIDRTQSDWVGKIIEVEYNERIGSRDQLKSFSLFLPRLARVRNDKSVADTIDNISMKGE